MPVTGWIYEMIAKGRFSWPAQLANNRLAVRDTIFMCASIPHRWRGVRGCLGHGITRSEAGRKVGGVMHPRRERTSLGVRRGTKLVFSRVVGSGFDVQKRSERRGGDHCRIPASPLGPNTGMNCCYWQTSAALLKIIARWHYYGISLVISATATREGSNINPSFQALSQRRSTRDPAPGTSRKSFGFARQ
jgi:hypothetical protein